MCIVYCPLEYVTNCFVMFVLSYVLSCARNRGAFFHIPDIVSVGGLGAGVVFAVGFSFDDDSGSPFVYSLISWVVDVIDPVATRQLLFIVPLVHFLHPMF